MKKILVIAAFCFPPSLIGPAILMGNLFKYFPKNTFSVLMGRYDDIWCLKDDQSKLDCSYYFTRYPHLDYRSRLRRILIICRDVFSLFEIFWKAFNIIRKEKIRSVFVVADCFVELPALLACRLTGKEMVLWLPDIYYRPDQSDWTRNASKILEPLILKSADKVLVTSEATQLYYKDKYGLDAEVLPHSVDLAKYEQTADKQLESNGKARVVFTGSVVKYNYDVISDMAAVINNHPELNAEFVIVANKPKKVSDLCNKYSEVTCYSAGRNEIPNIQQSADVLFLPLSFSEHDSIIKTASPSKLPEYLAAGRPILVYAPSSSYYAQYCEKEEFGFIVSEPDRRLLYEALNKILRDTNLRAGLMTRARETASKYHDAQKISQNLQRILGVEA